MSPPLLEARGLVKQLGGRRVVDGVDLVCHAGEVLGLLGPNGAGKTTTLRMLYGFLHPEAGEIRIAGSPDLARMKREIGVCTQNDTFDGDFSVEQNLAIAATYFRPRPRDVPARVRELLDRFGLVPFAQARPETLSGGFKRRLMMARALVHRPRLLFLDEPTAGVDPVSRRRFWTMIHGLARS
ncbi:MAG TPA: ABC transporter ATP-binding protein, partial [Terriglobales bacterium]|nr:ABC transporter ATP-binding protein [Terriglobales bacterium]